MKLRRHPKGAYIFSTHTPGTHTETGQHFTDDDGRVFVITGIKPLAPTRLLNGGYVPCWDVYGVPL